MLLNVPAYDVIASAYVIVGVLLAIYATIAHLRKRGWRAARMRFPANCFLAAGVAMVLGYRVRSTRNRSGRLHVYWTDRCGRAFEFYRKGASQRSYPRNALYFGRIKRAPSFDVPPLQIVPLIGDQHACAEKSEKAQARSEVDRRRRSRQA